MKAKANRICFLQGCSLLFLANTMSGLSVEMLSSIVSQLAGQGLTLPQGNTSNVGHSIINEDEVLVHNEEKFTMEELISKRKRNEKATQAQQTFSVGNSTVSAS